MFFYANLSSLFVGCVTSPGLPPTPPQAASTHANVVIMSCFILFIANPFVPMYYLKKQIKLDAWQTENEFTSLTLEGPLV